MKCYDCLSFQFIHVAAESRPFVIGKLTEAYQLPRPDFILSIQTSNINIEKRTKSGIVVETEHEIQRGLTETVKIASNSLTSFVVSCIHTQKCLEPWITTCCNNPNVMKLVQNALHRDVCGSDIPCIAFCNWKYVAGILNSHICTQRDFL